MRQVRQYQSELQNEFHYYQGKYTINYADILGQTPEELHALVSTY